MVPLSTSNKKREKRYSCVMVNLIGSLKKKKKTEKVKREKLIQNLQAQNL